jgi:hypothetical protein
MIQKAEAREQRTDAYPFPGTEECYAVDEFNPRKVPWDG